ncbi:hypothetical protein ACFSQT_23360 [Mesorhizobium calcicola]|uniref:Uncharacterized protein n=1 Tax=Mesorhizobium calcicola TaxID=1300310 RepID=A0ABW4WH36_9HYPH
MTGRTAIIVVGMHRSGTSALARMFSLLGASLPRNLNPAGLGNETGHWEPEAAVRLNDEILGLAESPVNDVQGPSGEWLQRPAAQAFVDRLKDLIVEEYGDDPLFVLKDPRISLLFPLWRAALAKLEIRCVAVVISRNPVEVALSLAKRQGQGGDWQSWPLDRGGLLWLRYNLAAEEHTRDVDRAFCDYSTLLDDWRSVARRLGDELNIAWPKSIPDAAAEIDGFLSRELWHHQEPEDLDCRQGVWSAWIAPIFSELRGAAAGRAPDPAVFGAVKQSFDDVYASIQHPPPPQRSSGRPRLRVMRRGTGRRKLCLVGDLFWKPIHGDGAARAAVDAAIAADIDVSIVDIGAFTEADENAFADFAKSHSFDVEYFDADGPLIQPSFLASTIQLLRHVRAQYFDAILFQDQDGLGYASAVAKQTGMAFDGVSLGVVAAGSSGWIRQQNGEFPSSLVTIGIEHLEKMTLERSTAQAIIAANSNALKGEVGRYVHSLQVALEERSREAKEAARYASSLEDTLAQLRKENETATEYARSLEQSRAQIEKAANSDALKGEAGRYVHSLQVTLEERSRSAEESARYASALEEALAQLRESNEAAAEYARSLEQSRAEVEEATDGDALKGEVDRYVHSLQAALEERSRNAEESARYASSLEETLVQLREANESAVEYARSLEQSRAQIEEYAKTLEAELEKIKSGATS